MGDIEEIQPEAIILSPGPKSPEQSGICLDIIEKFCGKIPILGICLGHQCIGYAFGAKVIKGEEPVHGKLFKVNHQNIGVFQEIENPLLVTRYHSLIIEKETLPECLTITCETADGVIMGVRHKEYLVEGVQFHPEAELTEYGHEMLKNFLEEARRFNRGNQVDGFFN